MNKTALLTTLLAAASLWTAVAPSAAAAPLRNDPAVRSMGDRRSYEPGGSRHLFGARGNTAKRTGKLTISSNQMQAGPLTIETVRVRGKIGYETHFHGHPWQAHQPFDNSSNRSESRSYGKITSGGVTAYKLNWSGKEVHPANGYDGEQGGNYPAPKGARDIYNYTVSGSAMRSTLKLAPPDMPPPSAADKTPRQPETPPQPPLPATPDSSNREDYINKQFAEENGNGQEQDNPDFSQAFWNRFEQDRAQARQEYEQRQEESYTRMAGSRPNPEQNAVGQYAERVSGTINYYVGDAVKYGSRYIGVDALVGTSAEKVMGVLPVSVSTGMAAAAETAAEGAAGIRVAYPNVAAVMGVGAQIVDILPTGRGKKAAEELGEAAVRAAKAARQVDIPDIGGQRVSGGRPTLPNDPYHPSNVDRRSFENRNSHYSDASPEETLNKKTQGKNNESKKSGKEKANDVPSWARGKHPMPGENGNAFAKRLMDEKYGAGNYKTGPNTEFNKLRKWGDRGFQ